MKLFLYSNIDHCSLIQRFNPLHVRKDGILCVFKDYTECYLSWLQYLQSLYPKGYIEFAHFFRVVLNFNSNEERSFAGLCYQRHGCDAVFLVDWSFLGESSFTFLKKFTMSVQLYYGTPFRLDSFKEAFNLFKNHESKIS